MFRREIVPIMCALLLPSGLGARSLAEDGAPAIVPRPVEMQVSGAPFRFDAQTIILVEHGNAEVRMIGDYLSQAVADLSGRRLRVVELPSGVTTLPGDHILLGINSARDYLGSEGYTLNSSNWSIELVAFTPCALFRGTQTIRQLLTRGPADTWQIPGVKIKDQPRYRWRGMLLDCGRHFMSKDFIKRYIDLLAYHKMNVLHWHLTEDQGWRIEIKKYPKLTEIGAWRQAIRDDEQPRDEKGRYGGFYTQDDVKEIVAYAKGRYITVVPEIELPGHSLAALASYPELSCAGGPLAVGTQWGVIDDVYCAGNDKTSELLEGVLSEVLELFPSEYIHIGGDECPKDRWKACSKCQARIKAEGLKDEQELQSYFIRRIEKFLNSKGRRLIGWDEILEGGLAPNATVQSWRGMQGAVAAATSGHDVISSPTTHCYLDHAQGRNPGEPTNMGFLPLERVYSFEPTPKELTAEQARHVLGLEGNMWTEHAPQPLVDRQVFPRLCALAEVGWSPPETRNWDDFSARMKTHYQRLDALGVTYYIPPPRVATPGTAFADSIDVTFEPPFADSAIHYTTDGSNPTPASPKYATPVRLTESAVVKAITVLKTGRASGPSVWEFKQLAPHEAVRVEQAEPGLAYAYYEGSWDRLPDFEKLTPAAKGVVPAFDLSMRKRDENYGLKFTGFIEVPSDGVYTFHLLSDDGSRLLIGADVVVDNDGVHPVVEKSGPVLLKAGRHPITVVFFQAREVARLEVSYEGPGITRQPIPASALSHAAGSP